MVKMYQLEQLSVRVPNRILLDDIHLCLKPARLYGLIGHNGSGKSSLIKVLAQEQQHYEGRIDLDGRPLKQFSAREFAKKVAYLPQKLADASQFTVQELVMLGRYPHQGWLQKATEYDKQIVQESMKMTGVAQFAEQGVATLSGGERARAWLAMCLAQQSQYLLLDEPLAALDIRYQVEVFQLIRRLVDERGLGVVIIVHDLNLAAQFCDELIALKQAKICHQGSVEYIMQVDILKEIFGIELNLIAHPISGQKVAVV